MLAHTLQNLERNGLVHRAAKPVTPLHADYSLTDLGRKPPDRSARGTVILS
jgi:DNA-binding HxlR family transcriptional regulator